MGKINFRVGSSLMLIIDLFKIACQSQYPIRVKILGKVIF